MPDVFISYSRQDKEFVERLNEGLEARGKDAWVDVDDIPASAEWLHEIKDGIDACDSFLIVLSPDSVISAECAHEVEHALERRKRILPIVHRDVAPAEVRSEIASINWVYLRDQDPFEQGLDTLVKALDTDLEYVKAHTRLASQAIHWERSGHDRARLLRGSELQEAERWLIEAAAKQPAATELQAQFVQGSREAARRRGRVLFGGVATALVVAVVLAIVALIQRSDAIHQTHLANARQLDAESINQYSSDPEQAVVYAVRAAEVAPGPSTEEALRQAMGRSHLRQLFLNPTGQRIGAALWSPDGSRLAIAEVGANRTVIVRPGTHAKPIVLQTPALNDQLSWAGRGSELLTGAGAPAIWNGTTGAMIDRLPTTAVRVAMSPNGKVAATADLSGRLHLWNVANGRELTRVAAAVVGTPGCLQWSPNGSELALCTVHITERQVALDRATPETVTVFSDTGRRLSVIHEPDIIDQVAFSPDGRRIAVAITQRSAQSVSSPGTFVYDARTGARELTLGGHTASAVAFSPNGQQLAYAELLGSIVYVYTFSTKRTVPLVGNAGTVRSIQFSHTSIDYVVTSSDDGTARVFNGRFGTQLEVLAGDSQAVTSASWSPDDTQIATASDDGTARIWDSPLPRPLASRKLAPGLGAIATSADGRSALVAGPDSATAWLLDSRTLALRTTFTPPAGERFSAGGFSPDGRWIVLAAGQRAGNGVGTEQLLIYEARTAKHQATISPSAPAVTAAVFTRPGELATILSDGRVDTWSATTGRHDRTLLPAGQTEQTISYSAPGGELAVSHPDGSIDVLRLSGGSPRTIRGPAPGQLYPGVAGSTFPVRAVLSPDGRWLAAAGGGSPLQGRVYVWNLATGRMRTLTAGLTPIASLAFSRDGEMLAAGDASAAYVWRFPSGSLIDRVVQGPSSTYGVFGELKGEAGVIASFSRAGTLISSGDFDVHAWRIATGQPEFDLPFGADGAASSDGQQILADAAGGELGVYRCELCGGLSQLLAAARQWLRNAPLTR